MSDWRAIEVYATFMKVTGEIEVIQPDRLTDAVNRFGNYLTLRNARTEPLTVNFPVLSRDEAQATVRKSAVVLICPDDAGSPGNRAMWRHKDPHAVAINTEAFSLVGDVHLDHRHTMEDHLERYPGDFIPITNLSALWVAGPGSVTHSVQRPFALLNPSTILSFAPR